MMYPIKDAIAVVSYSRDYVTRLAREHKILASYVGRQWFVDIDSLKQYAQDSALEQEIRKKQLSAERKYERTLREASVLQDSLRIKKAKTSSVYSFAIASLVLMCGLTVGLVTTQLTPISDFAIRGFFTPQTSQLAQTAVAHSQEVIVQDAAEDVQSATLVPVVHEPLFTREIHEIPQGGEGVLLLPITSQQIDIEKVTAVFSDSVMVRELPDGRQEVVRLDSEGNQVGEPIPFLIVPVNIDSH